jgi:glycosyltransferase involved in cell wall biosynthesis
VGVAVDSVLEQTFGDFELVVVDDGSSDATAAEVASRTDPRVRCVSVANGGVARARNHGLTLTSGGLVAFLDADDAWRPSKLDRQFAAMSADDMVGLCFTATKRVDDELNIIGEEPALPHADYAEALLTKGNIVPGSASSVMARRPLIWAAGGFDPSLSQCADWDLWLRMSLLTGFAAIAEPLVLYRKAPGTMSTDPGLLERDTLALLDKFFRGPDASPYQYLRRRAYGHHWMVCAGTYLHAGRVGDSLRCIARGVAADPRSFGRPVALPARWAARAWRTVQRG